MIERIQIHGKTEDIGPFYMYSIFAKTGDTTVAFNISLSEMQVKFFSEQTQMQFTVGQGIMVAFDKKYLDVWSIERVQ